MGSQQPTNRVDEVLAHVLLRHPGFTLEQSALVQHVWFGRVRRNVNGQDMRMDELEMALRDALDSSRLQIRSTTVRPDFIDLQVTAPLL